MYNEKMKFLIALIFAAIALTSVSAAPQYLTTRIAAIRDCGKNIIIFFQID